MMKTIATALLLLLLFCGAVQAAPLPGYAQLNTAAVTTTSFTDAGCGTGQTCYYYVTALNGAFESGPSSVATLTMPSGKTSVALAWNASTGATGYNVYVGRSPLPPTGLTAQ